MRWLRPVGRYWREYLLGIAVVGGWGLITLFVASLTNRLAWPLSGGFLLLSLSGWRWLFDVFTKGMYALSQGHSPPPPPRRG